jgi:hypothetical protein
LQWGHTALLTFTALVGASKAAERAQPAPHSERETVSLRAAFGGQLGKSTEEQEPGEHAHRGLPIG